MLATIRATRVLNSHRPVVRLLSEIQNQRLHDSHTPRVASTTVTPSHPKATVPPFKPPERPLSLLPLGLLIRSYVFAALSSNPFFLGPSLRLLSVLAHSKSLFLNPDRNPLIHYVLERTFYSHFCAGETPKEVQKTIEGLKRIGYHGVVLTYGKETVPEKGDEASAGANVEDLATKTEIESWKLGTLGTVRLAEKRDMVALSFTGAGRKAVHELINQLPPSKSIEDAVAEICELATARDVCLLFNAEQHAVQRGIDDWTLGAQRKYNRATPGKAVVYGTYQAYLRSSPTILAQHLAVAQREGFTLGVKLVRGAYLGSDPAHLFWSTKKETDRAFDEMADAVMRRKYNAMLKPMHDLEGNPPGFPKVSLVLASHNHVSVQKAMSVRQEQSASGEEKIDMVYAQLMGMADEVSCDLILAAKQNKGHNLSEKGDIKEPRAYKYFVWGTVSECLKYLVRRAEENKQAVVRAREGSVALRSELVARVFGR